MTDEELIRAVAEIEGHEYAYTDDQYGPRFRPAPIYIAGESATDLAYYNWNPLVNGNELVALIEKHRVNIAWLEFGNIQALIVDSRCNDHIALDQHLARAVLIVIVESKK